MFDLRKKFLGFLQRFSYKSNSVGRKYVLHVSVQKHWIYRVDFQGSFTIIRRDRCCHPNFFRAKQKHSCGSVPENEEWSAASCTHKFTSLPTEPWGTALETKSNKIAGGCRKPVEEDKGKQEKSPNRKKTTWDLLQICRPPGRGAIWVTGEPASTVLSLCHYKEWERKRNGTGKMSSTLTKGRLKGTYISLLKGYGTQSTVNIPYKISNGKNLSNCRSRGVIV